MDLQTELGEPRDARSLGGLEDRQQRPESARASRTRRVWPGSRHVWRVYLGSSLGLGLWTAVAGGPGALYTGIAFACAVAVVSGVLLWRPAGRGRWVLFAVGSASWAFADLAWTVVVDDSATFPSVADALYLMGYAAFVAAMVGVTAREPRDRASALDAGIATAGAAGLVLTCLVDAASSGAGTLLGKAVALSYPLLSLVLFGAAMRLWLSPQSRRASTGLLALAFGVQLVADAIYAIQSVTNTYLGGAIDLGWLTAYSLLGAAILHPSVHDDRPLRHVAPVTVSSVRLVILAGSIFGPLLGHIWFGTPVELALGISGLIAVAAVARVAQPINAMRRAATTDELTGLTNRPAVLDELTSRTCSGQRVVLLHCGIDRLRLLNSALGNVAGDTLIVAVADRLRTEVPSTGTTARIAGDEFLILIGGTGDDDGLDLATRLQAAVRRPLEIGDITVHPTISIGVVTTDGPEAPADALRRSDGALGRAKEAGRESIALAAPNDDDAWRRVRLAADLRHAIENRQITVVFQPEIDLGSGDLFGFEVLARWQHPVLGPIGPDVFIPIAEEAGLIDDLFDAVFDQALAAQQRWIQTYREPVAVAVNVSALQLNNAFINRVRAALARWEPPTESVWLELTESAVAENDTVLTVLGELRASGICLAIDDFGTGHSSLARLAAVDWQAIKIDRSFVSNMLTEPHTYAITAATIGMAKQLGLLVIGEGVETLEQRDTLTRLGCDYAQGYLVARPLALDDAGAYLRRRSAEHAPLDRSDGAPPRRRSSPTGPRQRRGAPVLDAEAHRPSGRHRRAERPVLAPVATGPDPRWPDGDPPAHSVR